MSLLSRIAEGDAGAVRACLDRFGGLVWSLALRFCRNRADAEDAVQDIFLELWRSAHRYDPARAAETTFVTILARRRLIDRKRREARQPETTPLPEELLSLQPDPSAGPESRDELDRVVRALSELSSEQQQAITLAIYQGLTHEEIASRLNLPLGTVKSHMRRGMLQLRERLSAGGVS